MSRASQTHRGGRRPEANRSPLRDLEEREHLDDTCDGRKPLVERLIAFEWLCDHKSYPGSIRDIESMLAKEVGKAGGEVVANRIAYRNDANDRLYRGWAPCP